MEIKVVYKDLMQSFVQETHVCSEKIIEIDNETTLKDIFEYSNEINADVSKYYRLGSKYYFNQKILSYIRKEDNTVIWEPSYDKVKVIDFIFTHDIKDNTIYADTGIIQAGGFGLKDIIQLWNDYYPVFDQLVTGVAVIEMGCKFSKFIKNTFVDKKQNIKSPISIIDLISSKKKWNHYELADSAELEYEEAKSLLLGFGYKWDNSQKLYIYEGDMNNLIEKFAKIEISNGL
ncbi:hypothetical protein [Clostridium baratii]|uniref:hypothetical protein n=1 Tax=Clostridium baratii TaxID=1561 RepID=UPI0005F28386|nr:hypothetical protein [Clostridium baratii]KJU72484.1 hypothetical protein UC77_04275 [Clostridium baratii]